MLLDYLIRTLNRSNVLENSVTDVDGLNRSKNEPDAPALTARVLETSTQPENESGALEVPLVDVERLALACPVRVSFAEVSKSRFIEASANPPSTSIPNASCTRYINMNTDS